MSSTATSPWIQLDLLGIPHWVFCGDCSDVPALVQSEAESACNRGDPWPNVFCTSSLTRLKQYKKTRQSKSANK